MRLFAFCVVAGLASAPAAAHMDAFSTSPSLEVPFLLDAAAPPLGGGAPSAPSRKGHRTPRPDPRNPTGKKVNPAYAGLAAAGAAGGTALVGGGVSAVAILALLGVFGAPSLPVTITAAVIGIGLGVATPFLAGLAGGGALLAMDPRTKPTEWSGLVQCATSGCCSGADLVGGTVLGGICGNAPQLPGAPGGTPGIPGPDKPAEWTAASGIAGLVGGGVVGGLLGWSIAPSPDQPFVPITIGALAGGTLGAALGAGVGGGLAEAIRK